MKTDRQTNSSDTKTQLCLDTKAPRCSNFDSSYPYCSDTETPSLVIHYPNKCYSN